MVWSCSGHSPPLSQTGQSSGWLMRRNSRTPSWAFWVAALWVSTTMSGATSIMQAGWRAGPRPLSMSTMHMRHMPTDAIRGW